MEATSGIEGRQLVEITREGLHHFAHFRGHKREAVLSESQWTISNSINSFEPSTQSRLGLIPQVASVLAKLHAHSPVSDLTISQGASLHVSSAYSLSQLEAGVASNPSLWVDGTQLGAQEKTPIESETMTAGELICLLTGSRGISTVQVYNGWDSSKGQPLYQPWVLELVERCLAHPDLSAIISTAPSDKDEILGLTLILYVNKEPFSSYAKGLAAFGFQSNIVAGSPFFKLLCGILLGYKEENCRSYVKSTSPPGSLTPALITQVDAEVRKLSKVKPKLPWSKSGSRGKKSPKNDQ
jgi:hypothetical protein